MIRRMAIGVLSCIVLLACSSRETLGAGEDDRQPAFKLIQGNTAKGAIITGAKAGPVEQTAIAKLSAGLQREGGVAVPIAEQAPADASHLIIIGTAKTNPELARLADRFKLPLQEIGAEGFLLKTLEETQRHYLVIAGSDPRGVLYGVQEALDQVITCNSAGDVIVTQCDIRRKPALAARGTYCLSCWGFCPRYERSAWEEAIDSMADAGMNRVMFWMDGLFRSRRFPDAFLNKPGEHFHGAVLTDDDIHKLIGYAHARGMDFYLGSGVFAWFTAGHFAKQFKEAADHTGGALCPSSPVAQKVTLEYLSEMIEVFPEADGYMLEIRDEMDDCLCPVCQKPLNKPGSKQFGQSEMDFLAKLTATVWQEHPRTKFIWLMGYANHNEDVAYYERLRELGRDPRMEWLEVRASWTLPTAAGDRKPLREFSDRIYHWDAYYRLPPEAIQDQVARTVREGLHGYLPAYEPGFANASVYATDSPTPFPVRLVPFVLTQFYYREFTWDPAINSEMLLTRAHRKFFSAEVPRQFADDLLFMRRFMAAHLVGLNHAIGKGLGPDGSGLLATVEDIWTVPRRGGDERKQKLLEGVAQDMRRFQDLLEGTGDMGRVMQAEKRMAELRPGASRRSRASFDLIQRALDDMRARLADCQDYAAEVKPALAKIDQYLPEVKARIASAATQPK